MKKKLDLFNFFFSSAAVVILIGVIAKILEWPSQDLLITLGLSIEAVVFALSSIKFVEAKKTEQGATEKTLSKMVEGLNPLKVIKDNDTSDELVVGETKPNISESFPAKNSTIHDSIQFEKYSISKFEKMNLINVSKDFYYQPDWFVLSEEDYDSLKKLIFQLFGKNLPAKSEHLFLKNSPIQLPDYSLSDLELLSPSKLSSKSLSLLIKSFKLAKFQDFLSNFILQETNDEISIRLRKKTETQVYYESKSLVAGYIETHYKNKLIKAPLLSNVEALIPLKGNELIRHLIDIVKLKELDKLNGLVELTSNQPDLLKMYLVNKIGPIEFNTTTNNELDLLIPFTKLLLTLNDTIVAKNSLNKLLTLKINKNTIISLEDVVYYKDIQIYFGEQNEYNLSVNDLFTSHELGLISYFEGVIELIESNAVIENETIRKLFGLNKNNTIEELHNKMNRSISIHQDGIPKAGQIAFNLLYKQFSK